MEINNPRGILLMALGMALFAVADTIAKVLLEHYPPAQVVFLRQLGLFFGVNFIMLYNLKWVGKSQNLTKQLLRGLSATGSAVIFLFGLRTIPIADATAIAFVAPLFVIIFSYFILKEPIGLRRWLAVVIGFSGTLIIIRPGFDGLIACDIFLSVKNEITASFKELSPCCPTMIVVGNAFLSCSRALRYMRASAG